MSRPTASHATYVIHTAMSYAYEKRLWLETAFLPHVSSKLWVSFFGQIGPNVSISANVRIGAGVRLISCIILDDVEIKVRKLSTQHFYNHDLMFYLYNNIFIPLTGKCSCYSFYCWVEVIYWQMVTCPGKSGDTMALYCDHHFSKTYLKFQLSRDKLSLKTMHD